MPDKYDVFEKRCPMLGHAITFKYCRSVNANVPCRKIMDCWFEQIPIHQYLEENFSAETVQNLLQPPKPKIVSLLEMIDQARAIQQNNQS